MYALSLAQTSPLLSFNASSIPADFWPNVPDQGQKTSRGPRAASYKDMQNQIDKLRASKVAEFMVSTIYCAGRGT